MKLVVLNARINGHNCAWADELYKILCDDFIFVEYQAKATAQKGRTANAHPGVDYYANRPFVLRMYESEANRNMALQLINEADVVRMTNCPVEWVRERIEKGKLTFYSGERYFKHPYLLHNPFVLWRLKKRWKQLDYPNMRILCQSAYLPNDMQHFGDFRERCYKFAYIHQFPRMNVNELMKAKHHDKLRLFWCARFLDWKHPELPVKVAEKLIESGRTDFEITMVGANTLKLWHETKSMVESSGLSNYITLTGGISNAEVLSRMRASNVFLFTSDRNEGWGVVLNEAMSSGCACVAADEIGATPFLLKDGENGLVFKSKSIKSLYEKVVELYDHPEQCQYFGRKAFETISGLWSAENVARRLVDLSQSILNGKEIEYKDGPCSKAYPIKE